MYNHTGYARNYNANCSIILFRGYYFYSREFTIYIFFPPLSSYLNRKQTFEHTTGLVMVEGMLEHGSWTDPATGFVSLLRVRDADFRGA